MIHEQHLVICAGLNGDPEIFNLTVPRTETSRYCDDRSIEEMINDGSVDGAKFFKYLLTPGVSIVPFSNQHLNYFHDNYRMFPPRKK